MTSIYTQHESRGVLGAAIHLGMAFLPAKARTSEIVMPWNCTVGQGVLDVFLQFEDPNDRFDLSSLLLASGARELLGTGLDASERSVRCRCD